MSRLSCSNIRSSRHGSLLLAVVTALAATACDAPPAGRPGPDSSPLPAEATVPGGVRPGIEVLLTDSLQLVRGRRVGLITNQTGKDRAGRSDIDLLMEQPEVELVSLFAPEHDIRGTSEAGASVRSEVDAATGLPIRSLYGGTNSPTPEMLEDVDVLLFDIQDVGARYYTYVSTMALSMLAAGRAGIPFVVLDRPNPIRGDVVQGDVLDPAFATFVGMYPVPMRHGMTVGELARLYVGEFGVEVDLHVVPMEGWTRDMTFDDTGLTWTPPSPNMPSLESALAYPGTCLFEGTPLSVGRGTERAFQWVGAPWLDGDALATALDAYGFAGVRFEPATFTPSAPGDGKFDGQTVHGVRMVVESSDFDAPRAAVAMLLETRRASGAEWSWSVAHFDGLAGTDALREGLDAGLGLDQLTGAWTREAAAFERLRSPYLLY